MRLSEQFLEAVRSKNPVSGYTHDFYRYPARFSPIFAREAILCFSSAGDTVVDPFMGGGTSLVEARLHGRNAVGTDLSSLAVFIAKVKTRLMSDDEIHQIETWVESISDSLKLRNAPVRPADWIGLGYQRNINTRRTWPTRKTIELALTRVPELRSARQQQFARCVLLKTAQWALDCRAEIPTASQVRQHFLIFAAEMASGAKAFSRAVRETRLQSRVACLQRSAIGIDSDDVWEKIRPPRLILTSPPYPGVHVLYHRWQIHGRRETPAPFWVAGTMDGCGASFYTFGDRKKQDLSNYYSTAEQAFRSLARIADSKTTVVQMVAFSDPPEQLPNYLAMMDRAGFHEFRLSNQSDSADGRLWRVVPNRKWYASRKGSIGASNEVVLFHRPHSAR
jgi:DNA methylase